MGHGMTFARRALAVAALAAAWWPATASQARAEEKKAALEFIKTADLIEKLKTPEDKRDFLVIDARPRVSYDEGRIPGAKNVPADQVKDKLPKVSPDKGRLLIFYCNGPKCTKSQKAARAAMAIGYTNVLEYNEGLPAWGQAQQKIDGTPLPKADAPAVAPALVAAEAKKGKAGCFLLDVRPKDEFAKFRVAGSVNIPLDDIEGRTGELPKGRAICVLDHAGHETQIASRLLKKLGRGDVKRLDGGLTAWREAGLSLVEAK